MCSDWGITCNKASVWRLYRAYALEWRLRLAYKTNADLPESPELLEHKTEQWIALRNFELLANPQSPPAALLALARIELRKKALEFTRLKYQDNHAQKLDLALDAFDAEVDDYPGAREHFEQLYETVRKVRREKSQPCPAAASSP